MRQRLLSLITLGVCFLIICGIVFYFFPKETVHPPSPPPPAVVKKTGPSYKVITLEEGDTLGSILNQLRISSQQAQDAIAAISEVYDPKDLKINQKIYTVYQESPEQNHCDLLSLSFQPDFDYEIKLTLENDLFEAAKVKKILTHEYEIIKGTIQISLYGDALHAGASPKMIYEMIKAFSYDIDFQRDIQPGTEFVLFYDTYKDPSSGLERPGKLLYAKLILEEKPYQLYHFHPEGGTPGYYSKNGEGIKKALLKTPIDGARLTSGFGHRRHPIKGYTKMHKGIDFAAPRGTPVMAAGDGVIERSSRYGGYGHYICIRHAGKTKTAYAHLNSYAKGIKPGKQVRQGQVIGYVGNTGQSTGCHLHFELIQNGKHINPKKITQLPGSKLSGKFLKKFKFFCAQIERMIQEKERSLCKMGI